MKRIQFILIATVLAGIFTSCDDKTNVDWTEKYEEGTYYVVKFNPFKVDYYQNVMMVPDENGKYYMRSLKNGGTCREMFMGNRPFIAVDSIRYDTFPDIRVDTIHIDTIRTDTSLTIRFDTIHVDTIKVKKTQFGPIYLVDWKWGLALSYSQLVLPMQWKDVRQPDERYYRSDFDVATQNIIDKIGVVKRSDIDRILNITPAPAAENAGPWGRTSGGISTDYLAPVYLSRYYSVQDIPEVIDQKGDWQYTKQDFIQERIRQDSLQTVYSKRLLKLVCMGIEYSVIKIKEQ